MDRFLRRSVILALVVLVGFAPLAAHAQTPASDPFLNMLALIPDYSASRGLLAYADYQAATEIFGVADLTYADVVESVERGDWGAGASFTEDGTRWQTAIGLVAPTAVNLQGMSLALPDMSTMLGFTPFEMRQGVRFGWPPEDGYIVTGDFDGEAIRAAFASRDYVRREIAGIEVWCYLDDCTTGTEVDFNNRSHANLFGGQFGRREPIALVPGVFMDSASFDTFQLMLELPGGTLAEATEFRLVAETLAAQGTVLQTYVFRPSTFAFWNFAGDDNTHPISEADAAMIREFDELPLYRLFAFAHTWHAGEHYGHFVLIYDTPDEAELAAKVLYERLTQAKVLFKNPYSWVEQESITGTFFEIFSQIGEVMPPDVFIGTDGAAAVYTVRAIPDEPDDPGSVAKASLFHLFNGRISMENFYFLGVGFTLPDEAGN